MSSYTRILMLPYVRPTHTCASFSMTSAEGLFPAGAPPPPQPLRPPPGRLSCSPSRCPSVLLVVSSPAPPWRASSTAEEVPAAVGAASDGGELGASPRQARTKARTSETAAAASLRADGWALPRRRLSTSLAMKVARSSTCPSFFRGEMGLGARSRSLQSTPL